MIFAFTKSASVNAIFSTNKFIYLSKTSDRNIAFIQSILSSRSPVNELMRSGTVHVPFQSLRPVPTGRTLSKFIWRGFKLPSMISYDTRCHGNHFSRYGGNTVVVCYWTEAVWFILPSLSSSRFFPSHMYSAYFQSLLVIQVSSWLRWSTKKKTVFGSLAQGPFRDKHPLFSCRPEAIQKYYLSSAALFFLFTGFEATSQGNRYFPTLPRERKK